MNILRQEGTGTWGSRCLEGPSRSQQSSVQHAQSSHTRSPCPTQPPLPKENHATRAIQAPKALVRLLRASAHREHPLPIVATGGLQPRRCKGVLGTRIVPRGQRCPRLAAVTVCRGTKKLLEVGRHAWCIYRYKACGNTSDSGLNAPEFRWLLRLAMAPSAVVRGRVPLRTSWSRWSASGRVSGNLQKT